MKWCQWTALNWQYSKRLRIFRSCFHGRYIITWYVDIYDSKMSLYPLCQTSSCYSLQITLLCLYMITLLGNQFQLLYISIHITEFKDIWKFFFMPGVHYMYTKRTLENIVLLKVLLTTVWCDYLRWKSFEAMLWLNFKLHSHKFMHSNPQYLELLLATAEELETVMWISLLSGTAVTITGKWL